MGETKPLSIPTMAEDIEIDGLRASDDDEQSPRDRLQRFLSQSPQVNDDFRELYEKEEEDKMRRSSHNDLQLDDATIPRTLRQSGSVDINDSIALDLKNESKVSKNCPPSG